MREAGLRGKRVSKGGKLLFVCCLGTPEYVVRAKTASISGADELPQLPRLSRGQMITQSEWTPPPAPTRLVRNHLQPQERISLH